jgi:NADPH2:quinone reductase
VDADLLALKPVNLTMREAAALPLIVITAWEGLVDRMAVKAGNAVLIQGGAGGVGHVAVQIAGALGATVYATGSAPRQSVIEALGAVFIDRSEPVADYVRRLTDGDGFDRVYDTAGGAALDAPFHAVRRFGNVASCLGWGSHSPPHFRSMVLPIPAFSRLCRCCQGSGDAIIARSSLRRPNSSKRVSFCR